MLFYNLIFRLTKSFHTNLLHGWNSVSGFNWYFYFCFSGSHLSKNCTHLYLSDSISKSFLLIQNPFSIFVSNNFNSTFFVCFFADLTHFIHTNQKYVIRSYVFQPIKITSHVNYLQTCYFVFEWTLFSLIFSLTFLKFSFIFSYSSLCFKIVTNSSRLIFI